MSKKLFLVAIVLVNLLAFQVFAQDEDVKQQPAKPTPDIANGKYGEFERNVFDLWKPKSKKPTPLVVYIHGGGFVNGSKEKLSTTQLEQMLKAGYAVMAINYRLLPGVTLPVPYYDSARAIQFARYHAKDWNIDKTKVAATGSSAGGLTSLWIAFHDDLADPKNADPVLRESTRLSAVAVFSAQTTLDPDILRKEVGETVMKHNFANGKAFGLKPDQVNTPAGRANILESSPTTFLTKDDPPVWAMYSIADKPMTAETTTSEAIHHPNFGKVLKARMDALKIECRLRHKDDGKNVNGDLLAFLNKYLK